MKRFIRLCLLTVVLGVFAFSIGRAEGERGGTIAADSVEVWLKEGVYKVNQEIIIKGTLIIEPGARVSFYDNGRLIVSDGGRLIADGFAKAKYTAIPQGVVDPIKTFSLGYADMQYALWDHGVMSNKLQDKTSSIYDINKRERTVHPEKNNHIFNVVISSATRQVKNLENPYSAEWPTNTIVDATVSGEYKTGYKYGTNAVNSNLTVVPFETALMYVAARMRENPETSPLYKTTPWSRGNGVSVDIVPATITFDAQTQTGKSREWGHIIVMPGARAAFFRNCEFKDFKKDTTVDRVNYYTSDPAKAISDLPNSNLTANELKNLNQTMLHMSNGGGGAITTFSSRTWLVNCKFKDNFARNRGGALQIYQAPTSNYYTGGIPSAKDTTGITRYAIDKNPNITDPNNEHSSVIKRNSEMYPAIDLIDEQANEYWASDVKRIAWDDARIAGYLGRFRNLEFDSNTVRLAYTYVDASGTVKDILDTAVGYPLTWGNMAYGGAIYVSGIEIETERQVEFGFGINDSIKMGGEFVNPNLNKGRDFFKMINNRAINLQSSESSAGAKGGAIYLGENTSLIVNGEFTGNYTDAHYLVDTTKTVVYTSATQYSLGGAIYANAGSEGRLQIRGSENKGDSIQCVITYVDKDTLKAGKTANPTVFSYNRAGAGGAVYVYYVGDEIMSPVIGGSDYKAFTSKYGYGIKFAHNKAYGAGGAIYSGRTMSITGNGGKWENYLYSSKYAVQFDSNSAGYAGGAVHVEIPNNEITSHRAHTRLVNIARADFNYNVVGEQLAKTDKVGEIRGGGAIYTLWADLNVVKATHFNSNKVYNGNGGAIEMAATYLPNVNKKMFISDLDEVHYAPALDEDGRVLPLGVQSKAIGYTSINNPFTYGPKYPQENATQDLGVVANLRMLTRFNNNSTIVDSNITKYQIESYGNTQMSKGYIMPNADIYDQWWSNASFGFLAGSSGNLIKVTKNNGQWVWENQDVWENETLQIKDDNSYTAIHFVDGMLIGYLGDNYGNIRKSEDQGETWPMVYENPGVDRINDFSFLGEKGFAVTEEGRILSVANKSANWIQHGEKYKYPLNGVATTSMGTYAVGDRGLVLKSTDGGASWNEQIVAGLNKDLRRVVSPSVSTCFAVGAEGTMIYTKDAGMTWFISDIFPADADLTTIVFYGQDKGYIGTSKGDIYNTTDGGTTWTSLNKANGRTINSLYFYDANNGFASSYNDFVQSTSNAGVKWDTIVPANRAVSMGNPRMHANISSLVENGTGLGGAIYVLDEEKDRIDKDNNKWVNRLDSVHFNRVRFTDNFAVTGSVIYSDNYDLKLVMNRSLVTGNKTSDVNTVGRDQNAIDGPYDKANDSVSQQNLASSDLAAVTIYGELQGPLPNSMFSTAANSVYDNQARFLIRLPDAPNTKGVLAGQGSVGAGGTISLKGNYWGQTEANVTLNVVNSKFHQNPSAGDVDYSKFTTFFVAYGDDNYLPFYHDTLAKKADLRKQGPFEYNTSDYNPLPNPKMPYTNIDLKNADNDPTKAADLTIPEKYLFSSGIYDLYDKGTDIKTADYSQRRMFPIEDFAVGNPVELVLYEDENDSRADKSKKMKYVKRYIRNPKYADAIDGNGNPLYPDLNALQGLWKPFSTGAYADSTSGDGIPRYYQPLAMPIYLEAEANFEGNNYKTNWDPNRQAETVFFIINETTMDYIRVALKQVPNDKNPEIWSSNKFRATVRLVPDSTSRVNNGLKRREQENLRNLGSDGTYPFSTTNSTGGSNSAELLKNLCPRYFNYNEVVAATGIQPIDTAARNEDFAALIGRKYTVTSQSSSLSTRDYGLGNYANIYSNRPTMPKDNEVTVNNVLQYDNTYFAGERYATLPADTGDVVRVISRSILWKDSVTKAYDGGLVFKVTAGPEAPVFTGDIVTLKTDSLNPYLRGKNGEFPPIYTDVRPEKNGQYVTSPVVKKELLNKIFLTTNRAYPVSKGTYSTLPEDNRRGTDNILTIAANDVNKFYDPRSELFIDDADNKYTRIGYTWTVSSESGLLRWMMADTIPAGGLSPVDGTALLNGAVQLKGDPLNPYIVPGGEPVRVTAFNYPPDSRMIDSLKAAGITDTSVINRYFETFKKYFNTPFYYGTNSNNPDSGNIMARFLQQDTLGFAGSNITNTSDVYIYVGDSLPRFIDYKDTSIASTPKPATFKVKKDNDYSNVTVDSSYHWSWYQAGLNKAGKVMATLTDSLRLKIDLNTDDELEDKSAEGRWDFRYGRTAYAFANTGITVAGDTVVIDTIYDKTNAAVLSQLKPSWMNTDPIKGYFKKYNDASQVDEGQDLQLRAQMNIRIEKTTALTLLRDRARNSRDSVVYNTDTIFALVANDGHGGVSAKFLDLFVNIQPAITTAKLDTAIEQVEYNPDLLDTISKRIFVYDPNSDQKHEFYLIYPDTDVNAITGHGDTLYADPFFKPESGKYILDDSFKTTPTWLKINKESGMLHGTPDLLTNLNDSVAKVTVVVKDEDGLFAIAQLAMPIKKANNAPTISVAPILDCLVSGYPVASKVTIVDKDLIREGNASDVEKLVLSVEYPASLTIEPAVVDGPYKVDGEVTNTVEAVLKSTGPFNFDPSQVVDGKIEVKVKVTDRAGLTDALVFKLNVSEPVDFVSELLVSNAMRSSRVLLWGTAPSATTGDALDEQPGNEEGKLDSNYCELEIPEVPPGDVFDVRWNIPRITGTYRNIFPTATQQGAVNGHINFYQGEIQPGGVTSQTSHYYPLQLKWIKTTIPGLSDSDKSKNPTGAKWVIKDGNTDGNFFAINMNDPNDRILTDIIKVNVNADTVTVSIIDTRINSFKIWHYWDGNFNSIDATEELTTSLVSLSPNPANGYSDNVKMNFDVTKAGNVYIEIFNDLGEKVATVVDSYYDAGQHDVNYTLRDYKGTRLSSGAYTVRFTSGMATKTLQLIVLN